MTISSIIKKQIAKLPNKPGVYLYYDKMNNIIYIGKATNLKNRVKSYFRSDIDIKTHQLVSNISKIKFQQTNSVLEAVILESNLIKKYQPYYNIKQKDDKSFSYIYITNEDFPRVFISRPSQLIDKNYKIKKSFGPFLSQEIAKELTRILRKIFKFRDCVESKFISHSKKNQACLFYGINQCNGSCSKLITKKDYQNNINNLILLLSGKNKHLINKLKKEMIESSKKQNYETALIIRGQIFALTHLNDLALIKKNDDNKFLYRVEVYDISNIFGKYAVGAMSVLIEGKSDKTQYRKFKIKTVTQANDPKMMLVVISRRLNHQDWSKPNLVVIDGGLAQINAVKKILDKNNLDISLMSVAKGANRKNDQFFFSRNCTSEIINTINLNRTKILHGRNEAHRFALNYHKLLRSKNFI